MSSPFTLENEAFRGLIFYGTLALAKTTMMSFMTGINRMKNRAFNNPEDYRRKQKNTDKEKKTIEIRSNEAVERVRRAHLNDLENIVPFVLLGALYVGTNPSPTTALWHFRMFFWVRVLHTLVYLNQIRQPARLSCFTLGACCFFSMAIRTLLAVW